MIMLFRAIKKFLAISLLLIVFFSCSKQKAPELGPEEVRGSRELERLEACTRVNFNQGVLLYRNIVPLFTCAKWDEQFPKLFESLSKTSAMSWDHLITPFSESFIDDHKKRDRFFSYIKELDSKNGLDDLSYVLVALNETNFFSPVNLMFSCIDNPSAEKCSERLSRLPTKRDIKDIFQIIDSDPDNIVKLAKIFQLSLDTLGEKKEELRNEVNRFRKLDPFIALRLNVINSILAKIRNDMTASDRSFLPRVFLARAVESGPGWFYQWLHQEKLGREKFRDLIEYPILVNPKFIDEFTGVKKLYETGFRCAIKDTKNPNQMVTFDFRTQLYNLAEIIQRSNQMRYFEYASEDIMGMKLSTEVCEEIETNQFNVNLISALANFSSFVGEKSYYDLVKFLVNQSPPKNDQENNYASNLYLADLVVQDIFKSTNNLNKLITTNARNFYPTVYDILTKLPAEEFDMIGEVLESSLKEENHIRLQGLSNTIDFFDNKEKNFLFNFIDRHFDNEIDYALLFDFYNKFLLEFKDAQPKFKELWLGDKTKEEKLYLSIQDLVRNLEGEETLSDFRKFFSRDQILRILEVISNGQTIRSSALEELAYVNSDNYILKSRAEKYKYKVIYKSDNDTSYDSREVVTCMKAIAEKENGFYDLLRRMPETCTRVTDKNIAFVFYGWLNAIDSTFSEFKKGNLEDSLFDKKGILSPYMVNTSIALIKVLDSIVGPLGSAVPTKNGIEYTFDSLKFYLNEKNGISLLEDNFNFIDKFGTVLPERNLLYRNSLIKEFTRNDNFEYSKTFFSNIAEISKEYGAWLKSSQYKKSLNKNFGTPDPRFKCENFINQVVAPNPCPSPVTIKKLGNELLILLANRFEESEGSPASELVKALKAGEGYEIPLDAKKTSKYRLSLQEMLRYFYETSERSLAINNTKIKYTDEKNKTTTENLTTLERIETVIREVRFDNNYIGVSFLNAVVHGDDYDEDVNTRKKLYFACVKIPGARCGRKMSDEDLRMAKNSVEVYDSLLDVNNGRGLEPKLNFGNFLKTFEATLVGSSAKAAQEVSLRPLKDEVLKKHNGKVLANLTLLTGFSNTARFLRDRIGRNRSEFEDFLKRDDFKRVDKAFLYGFELRKSSSLFENVLKRVSNIKGKDGKNLFENAVDYVSELNYEETRLLEDTIAKMMVVGSYLGPADIVFNKDNNLSINERYKGNNLFQVVEAADKLIQYWPIIEKYFPQDTKLIDVIKPLNRFLNFLTIRLSSTNIPENNFSYLVLNDVFVLLQKTLFEPVSDPRIGQEDHLSIAGIDILVELLRQEKLVTDLFNFVRANYKFLDNFHQNDGETFETIGQNLKRIAMSTKIDFSSLKDYLMFTSKNYVCISGDSKCSINYHHDEPYSLIRFSLTKTSSNKTYLRLMNEKLFNENYDKFVTMINDLLPPIVVKEVVVPLNYN